jgi:hypothetical protein
VQIGDRFDEVVANIGGVKGPRAGTYLIVGPDFHGEPPGEMTLIRSRTTQGLVAVGVFVAGQDDVAAAAQAQAGQHLDPAVARGLARASTTADQVIDARWHTLGETTNGWRYYTAGGRAVHD